MPLIKTLIGYHKADGGKVFRYSNSATGMSFIKCDACSRNTVSGGFDLINSIASDITAAVVASGIDDLPTTHEDHLQAFDEIVRGMNSIWGPFSGYVSFNNPFGVAHKFGVVTNSLNTKIATILNEQEELIGAKAELLNMSYAANPDSSIVIDGTVMLWANSADSSDLIHVGAQVLHAEDSTASGWSGTYASNPFSDGAKYLKDATPLYPYLPALSMLYYDGTATDLTIMGNNRVFPSDSTYNFIHILIYGATELNGTAFMDWTRPTTGTVEISHNNGISWEKVKWIDSTNYVSNVYPDQWRKQAWIKKETMQQQYKLRLIFKGDPAFGPRGFYSVNTEFYRVPVDEELLIDTRTVRYTL